MSRDHRGGGFAGGSRGRFMRMGPGYEDQRGRGGGPGIRGHYGHSGGGGQGFGGGSGYGGYRGDSRGRSRGGYRGGSGGNFNSSNRSHYPPTTENERYIYRKGNGNHYPKYVKNAVPLKRLSETDVGITEYISTHEGFNGIIKQRFSDFHVNEVDPDGNIVTLQNLDVPKSKAVETVTLEEVFPKETVDKLRTLLTDFGRNNKVEIDVSAMPKDERKRIHIAIRGEFGDKLNSNTKTTGDTKILIIARSDKFSKQDVRLPWPEDRAGKYLHFVLYKENLDTMEAISYVASRFRMNPSMVTYAGTKDKRAMSSQKVAMFKIEPSRLIEKCHKQKRITFGNFEFKPDPLKLGSLMGNRFRITLRNVTGTEEQIEQSMSSLKEKGFINYYGLQRFGNNSEVPTYEIGRELLLANWKKVVELILKPRRHDPNLEVNQARQVWWETGHASQAFNIINRQDYTIEGKLLSGLVKRGESNYMDALELVPRNTRLLYLHAYQSLIWNKVVSRRVKEFGLKPIVGDMVLLDEIKSEVFFEEEPLEETSSTTTKDGASTETNKEKELGADETEAAESELGETAAAKQKGDDDVEMIEVSKAGDNGEAAVHEKEEEGERKKPLPEQLSKRPAVKILAEEDLSGYTIKDIILPLPGFDVVFPENCVKDWYEEYLKADGLSIAGMKQKVKKYSLGGAYRKLIITPENFTWRVMRYTNPDKTLILSDLEKIQKVVEPEDDPNGQYRALLLDFQLPSSAYATMALRDILKRDTSTSFQATLNMYHDKKDEGDASMKRKEGKEAEADESTAKKAKAGEEAASEEGAEEVLVEAAGDK